jgi:hypothetical protein
MRKFNKKVRRFKRNHSFESLIYHTKFSESSGYYGDNLVKDVTNSMAQEPEGSSPHSQQFATGPYPEPVESNPHP